jgi:hypothetical protein
MSDQTRFDELITKFKVKCLIDKLMNSTKFDPDLTHPKVGDDWQDRFKTPTWDAWAAMKSLGIERLQSPGSLSTDVLTDSIEGKTNKHGLWVRPDALFPVKVIAHELAHNVLGHIGGFAADKEKGEKVDALIHELWADNPFVDMLANAATHGLVGTLKAAPETEAELTAFLVADAAGGLQGDDWDKCFEYSSGYFLGYMPVVFVDDERVKRAADQILAAGRIHVAQEQAA